MILIISGTNRKNSNTFLVADYYANLLSKRGNTVQLLNLADLPNDWLGSNMYIEKNQHPALTKIQDTYFKPARKIVIFSPEYNGSYPGVLKLLIDGLSVRNYTSIFTDKKVALLGISTGRAGNLLGLHHLAPVCQHMGAIIYPNFQPISQLNNFLIDKKKPNQELTDLLEDHIEKFLKF